MQQRTAMQCIDSGCVVDHASNNPRFAFVELLQRLFHGLDLFFAPRCQQLSFRAVVPDAMSCVDQMDLRALHKTHRRPSHSLGTRFGTDTVVLVRLHVRLHMLRRHQAHIAPLIPQSTA